MKKYTLDLSFDYDFALLGVVAACKDYKLAWKLNNTLSLHLIKQPDLPIEASANNNLLFSHFRHFTEHSELHLLRNRSVVAEQEPRPYLLPDRRHFNYLLKVQGLLQDSYFPALLQKIKDLPLIQYVEQLDPYNLKFKENLIF